jgi:hypothetical protein
VLSSPMSVFVAHVKKEYGVGRQTRDRIRCSSDKVGT